MKNNMLKKYQQVIQKVNNFDFSDFDDSDLLERIDNLKAQILIDKAIPEIFAIIKEIIDRRLGIWKLFNFDLPEHFNHLSETYAYVKNRRSQVDSSQIHLGASFYADVRRLRQPQDGLTFMPFDVQLLGALALLDGKIAEMGTGEGKTVVAVFPACAWTLSGKKVHIATVNDYLALRDCMWMSPVYRFFGLEVDCVLSYMPDSERRNSYKADIVYGNNYEFGFDCLRDNLINRLSDRVQGKLECVIIDEIDSILMDEAATPLIISGTPDKSSSNYWRFKSIVESLIKHQNEIIEQLFNESDPQLRIIRLIQIGMADPWNPELLDYLNNDKDAAKKVNSVHGKYIAARSEYKLEEDLLYVVDEKNRTVKLTDKGIAFAEQLLGEGFLIYRDPQKSEDMRNFLQLLRAYTLHRKDEDYIVHNGGIILVDEFTGRLSFGKKYEEGLHQAIECKEGLQITPENRVMGKITHPNYFRLYEKKAGMTATAHTEADEFKKLYKLEVVRIPTNKPVIRTDLQDRFFKTEEEKIKAIIEDIKECHSPGRPVLIGTRSVEKSEHLSTILKEHGISHNVLNAKNHSEEAEIIKNAGELKAVTIATNMAGRGVDIALGEGVKDLGGLHVIGTERHTARRIDDQLIGRSGRQGDHGSSRFYLSLQDDLFRMFAGDDMSVMVKAVERGYKNKMTVLTRKAQRKSEETSYSNRKQLIEHDDVSDKQRKVIYKMRSDVLSEDETETRVRIFVKNYVDDLINSVKQPDGWNVDELRKICARDFGVYIPELDVYDLKSLKREIITAFRRTLEMREQASGKDFSGKLEKAIMIEVLDTAWTDYLSFQNTFDNVMMLRSYVKSNILTDYKLESAKLFKDLLTSIRYETLKLIFTYPLPDEKSGTIRRIKDSKPISDQIRNLLSKVEYQ